MVADFVKSGISRPPRRQGSASSSRSASEIEALPVKAGMNSCLMMSYVLEVLVKQYLLSSTC